MTAILDNTDGVRTVQWLILRTDDTTIPAAYTLVQSGSVGQQVDTNGLTEGTAAALQCVVNGGIDLQTGSPSASMTALAKFFVPTINGLEVLNGGEFEDGNTESSPTHGAVTPVNAIIRVAGGDATGDFKASVKVATDGALAAYTRVSNTITANANGALANVDGVAMVVGDRLLLKDGAAGADNGIWEVTQLGSAGDPFILDRTSDADTSQKVSSGEIVPVSEGTSNADQLFMLVTNDPIVLNTTALVFVKLSSAGGHVEVRAEANNAGSPFAVSSFVSIVGCRSATGVIQVDLPSVVATPVGRCLTIADEDGQSAANNITIQAAGAELIDTVNMFPIAVNFGALTIYNTGSIWKIR